MEPPEQQAATESVVVEIKLPLPADVVTTITRLIASAYPQAQFSQEQGFRENLKILLPSGARPRPTRRRVPAARASAATVTESGPRHFGIQGPQELTKELGELIHRSFVDHPDAKHYLELRIRHKDSTYLVYLARGAAHTPQILHMAAERRAKHFEARLAELTAADASTVKRVAVALARQKYEAEQAAAAAAAAQLGRELSSIPWGELGDGQHRLVEAECAAASAALAAMREP